MARALPPARRRHPVRQRLGVAEREQAGQAGGEAGREHTKWAIPASMFLSVSWPLPSAVQPRARAVPLLHWGQHAAPHQRADETQQPIAPPPRMPPSHRACPSFPCLPARSPRPPTLRTPGCTAPPPSSPWTCGELEEGPGGCGCMPLRGPALGGTAGTRQGQLSGAVVKYTTEHCTCWSVAGGEHSALRQRSPTVPCFPPPAPSTGSTPTTWMCRTAAPILSPSEQQGALGALGTEPSSACRVGGTRARG